MTAKEFSKTRKCDRQVQVATYHRIHHEVAFKIFSVYIELQKYVGKHAQTLALIARIRLLFRKKCLNNFTLQCTIHVHKQDGMTAFQLSKLNEYP